MSVESTRAAPQVETVLTIWQETLNEATLTVDHALAVAGMMLGFVLINSMPNEVSAHAVLEDLVRDIHGFIGANWKQGMEMRKKAGKPGPDWSREANPALPGTAVDELKRMIDQAGSINAIEPPNGGRKIPGESQVNQALTFTPVELQAIIDALADLPYFNVAELIDLIKSRMT